MYIFAVILLLVVVIFGVASTMQSYASAQQAQATIEVAQAAQVNAWGNLLVILALVVVLVSALALIGWVMYRRSAVSAQRKYQRALTEPVPTALPVSIETLIQLETLRLIQSMRVPPALMTPDPTATSDAQTNEDFTWLRGPR
jgi:heme/copper-type cytochrome/quinol oxidase subunit 2